MGGKSEIQLLTHRVPPWATGHLWLPSVFFVEKNRPQSSQENSQILPCFATSCRRRSCCLEKRSWHPRVQGNEERGLGLCASMCTFRVYWLVNLLSQPIMAQGNRRRDCWGSTSGRNGEGSLENSFLISMASRLEHEIDGECEKEVRGERWTRRACDGHEDVDEFEKLKLKAFVYSCRLGCGESDKPESSKWVNVGH